MHWADAFVQDLSGHQTVSTGISPSGPIHVGNMREIVTGDLIYRAAVDRGLDTRFIYMCDDMDPLRKVYPFLDQKYAAYVGWPLCRIPAPEGDGTYSEYFLRPFLDTLEVVGIEVEVIRAADLYRKGILAKAIDLVLTHQERVKQILEEISGRAIEKGWSPYNPICTKCGKITSTSVISYEYPYVEYTCKCGNTGRADIRTDQGKLPWRIEWPAKWMSMPVTIEPFGKDHGAPGGSYDTGKAIVEEIFGVPAPKPMTYERILLKGKGVMHSSTGVVIPASDMVHFAPPQILRFLIARSQPERHIDFDPAAGLLNLIDEYEKYRNMYFGLEKAQDGDSRRIYELSRIREEEPGETVGFRHLLTLVQIYSDEDKLLMALKRGGYDRDEITPELRNEIEIAKSWLARYGPDQMRFALLPDNSPVTLSEKEKNLLAEFVEAAGEIEWSPEKIHDTIHALIKDNGMEAGAGFAAFYKTLIGKERGPRLGYFLSNLDSSWVIGRLRSVLSK